VAGHHVHTQQVAGADHVLAAGPVGGAGALPGIAAVHQQGPIRAVFVAQALDQGAQVGEPADLAIGLGRLDKIQIGEGIGLGRVGLDTVVLEEGLAHDVRWPAAGLAKAEVDARLAEVDGQELGMAVGHVHQGHVAELRDRIGILPIGLGGGGDPAGAAGLGVATGQHAGGGGHAHDLDEFTAADRHSLLLT